MGFRMVYLASHHRSLRSLRGGHEAGVGRTAVVLPGIQQTVWRRMSGSLRAATLANSGFIVTQSDVKFEGRHSSCHIGGQSMLNVAILVHQMLRRAHYSERDCSAGATEQPQRRNSEALETEGEEKTRHLLFHLM
ncbi:hypothetical protein AAFF_G00131210 [Aldrovandia affinis]|uniref:Uncharacterized protein n=1 Tax=Aldrovandia affinis TaxID=143900 RepID=A0AAD7RQY9_9TELE|nr:hypothetical protein AAFF_G00131210 [Aldrovandia affinis]